MTSFFHELNATEHARASYALDVECDYVDDDYYDDVEVDEDEEETCVPCMYGFI